jgi:hypothetical protein
MSRSVFWTAAVSLVLTLLVATSSGVSTGEDAHRDGDDDLRSLTDDLECDACHDQTSFKAVSKSGGGRGFDHDRTGFKLEGRHREVGCTECHVAGRTINGECAGCHEDPHRGGMGNDCDRCHTSTSFHLVRATEIHEQTGFPLTGRHASADCTECHIRNGERRFTGVPHECFACHEDDYRRSTNHPVHTGTATTPPFPRDCEECHRPTTWSLAIIDPSRLPGRDPLTSADAHDSRFPITYGPHRGAPCESCHVSPSVHRAVRCTGCHAHDPARLRATHGARLVSFSGAACLACHRDGSVP